MLPAQDERNYKVGDLICREHEKPDGLFIVKEGLVEIFQTLETADGPTEVVLGRVGARGIFGEMGLIDHQPRSASARALGPSTLVFVSNAQFQKHVQQLPPWVAILIRTMVHRLRETNHRLAESLEKVSAQKNPPGKPDMVLSTGDDDNGYGQQLLQELERYHNETT